MSKSTSITMEKNYKILCINPGSTSTKLAWFDAGIKLDEISIEHPAEEISRYQDILGQLPMRKKAVEGYLCSRNIPVNGMDAIAVRGAPVGRPYHGGAYLVDRDMYDACLLPQNAGHAMCLAPIIAFEWVRDYNIPAFCYDVVMVDELRSEARITALPEICRTGNCHVLNARAVARKTAEAMGRSYQDLNLIVCHMGGGCSTSLHEHGRITDVVSSGEGGFTPSRTGRLPFRELMRLCYSGQYDQSSLNRKLNGNSGFVAHLGTSDCREVEQMAAEGNEKATIVYEAFIYNMAKDITSLASVVCGQIDGIILTGGIAHSQKLTKELRKRVEFLAPVTVFPGAIEMEALADGISRVLRGEEEAHHFSEPF